jgi:hypothetical protein
MALSEIAPDALDDVRGTQRLGFCSEMLQQATNTVTNCEGYSKIEPAMRAVSGCDMLLSPKGRSNTWFNEIGRVAEIMHANFTDTKPACEYRTFNRDYSQYAIDFTKLWKIWYYNNAVDMKFGAVADYAMVGGSGYAHQYWNKRTRDIDIMPVDGRDVRPVDSVDNTIASCYGVHVGRDVPLTWAQAMFPHMAAELEREATWQPAAKLPELSRDMLAKSQSRRGMSPFFAAREDTDPREKRDRGIRSVKLWWFYFNDPTIVDAKDGVEVGDFDEHHDPITSWSYRAPYGTDKFPRKRLIVFSKGALCHDGPNPYWHGMFPVSKFTIMPWPWLWLGSTPIWDCLEAQNTLTNALRVWDDHIRRSIRPPISADKNTDEETLRKISEMIALPGAYWRNNIGGQIKTEEMPMLDQALIKMVELTMQKIPQRCGVEDLSPLLSAGQIPEGDTVDRLLFATSPLVRLRSRMFELFYREQGRMFLFNAVQNYTVRRKFAALGSGSMKPMDYMYDPNTFLPMLPGDEHRQRVDVAADRLLPFEFWSNPSSLLRAAAMSDRAEALALFRLGAIDPETLLEQMDYQNIDQVMQRVQQMLKTKLEMAAAMQSQDTGVPQRPIGGDPRGRKPTSTGAPQLRDSGYVEGQH